MIEVALGKKGEFGVASALLLHHFATSVTKRFNLQVTSIPAAFRLWFGCYFGFHLGFHTPSQLMHADCYKKCWHESP